MNLNRLLLLAILLPSVFVVGIVVVSYIPHREELFTHEQEHLALAATIVAGIIPFSYLMLRLFRRIQEHILRQNAELSRRTTEMEALLRVGQVVGESLDLDQVLPAALEAVIDGTTAESAEVWLLDPNDEAVRLLHHRGAASEAFLEIVRLPLGEGYPGIVAQTGKPILVHDLQEDERFLRQRVKDEGFETFYALPLRGARGTIGVLAVAARDAAALTMHDELRLLELMAEHIAKATENAQLHQQVETLAIFTERERLAREMHDGLAQVLGYVNTKAQAVKELLKEGQVTGAVRHMEQLEVAAQETYDDVREAILALSSNGRRQPLVESLREYVDRFSDFSGLPAELVVDGPPQAVNPAVEVQLLRIVQEALANARKHAAASSARVTLSFGPTATRVEVVDDGRGFDPGRLERGPWPHLGLQSMRERAAAIGAGFTLDTVRGRGTRVILDLPGAAP